MKTSRNMTNLQIAKLLRAVAAVLELSAGDNRFRVIAYERASDAVEHASSEVKDLWDDGKLKELAGVGDAMAAHLDELFRTGRVKHFDLLLKAFPPALFELMEIPGVGPKTALKLCKEYGITRAHSALSKLEKAAKKDGLDKILQGIIELKGRSRRLLLPAASEIADSLITWLHRIPQVKRADPLGSLRRMASTVGDIDIAVASDQPRAVIEHFTKYPQKSRVLEAGDHSASLILPNQYQVDVMVQPPAGYGALLQHFTGNKHHNIKLRELALKKGYSLSEYGVTPLHNTPSDPPLTAKTRTKGEKLRGGRKGELLFPTEEKLYEFLGLQWIPPELREGENEIELAKTGKLPHLVEIGDIKGDLQIHSDIDVEPSHDLGISSLSELSTQAIKLGYEYIGVTEHNPSVSRHTQQQVIDLVKMKSDIVHKFNSSEKRVHIFSGLEIDIQPNGNRALSDAALNLLDYACVSIHSSFSGSRQVMTDRVLKALDHPKIRFFAHPTARLLQQREGVELDWDRIFDYCLKNNKWLEIDAWPNRLDLPDTLVHQAVKYGVKLVVDTDSHAANHMPLMRYGVAVARRGWATAADIINTCSLTPIKKLLY